MRGGAEGHLATPKNVNIGPNCSVNDGDSCVSNHDCTHNACKSKVHVNGAVGFVHMSGNELQRS